MTVAIAFQQQEYVLLHDVSWNTYQALVRELATQPAKRITYSQGDLEIMVPLPPHEEQKDLIHRIILTVTEELNIYIRSLGQTTWQRPDLEKGLEADSCYYIQNEPAARGKSSFDLTVDSPPDLVVEIENTRRAIARLPVYAALNMPEVWRYDGTTLTIYHLIDGEHRPQESSLALPMLQRADLQRFLQMSKTMNQTPWGRELRCWVRETLC